MRVPVSLTLAFGQEFQDFLTEFLRAQELLPADQSLDSSRFISRSILPHVERLSAFFNRRDEKLAEQMGSSYWKKSAHPENLRLAYFIYFMPCNLFRVASVWAELWRLGYRIPKEKLKWSSLELGAGPATATSGIAAAEKFAPCGIPAAATWALIEQDKQSLKIGTEWAPSFFHHLGFPDWQVRPFHRCIDWEKPLLPRTAPSFDLWLMSYVLNEAQVSPSVIAKNMLRTWSQHLEPEGLVILVEPALKSESRKVLELRRHLIEMQGKDPEFQILTPCLGSQTCGALKKESDWCHEEVTWWRPPYLRKIDAMAKLDRKNLPFSYLVVTRSRRPIHEILPGLAGSIARHRVVSPAHAEGRDWEFFLCGDNGKTRVRARQTETPVERGSILLDVKSRGDAQASRLDEFKPFVAPSDEEDQRDLKEDE